MTAPAGLVMLAAVAVLLIATGLPAWVVLIGVAMAAAGALLAPMNGSVGASVAMLGRSVLPQLRRAGMPEAQSAALVCVASTLGVVVPPSLVLILLSARRGRNRRVHRRAAGRSDAGLPPRGRGRGHRRPPPDFAPKR